jgi:hypothetical protein
MGFRRGYDGVSKGIRENPLPDTVLRPSRRRMAKRAQPHGIGRLSLRFIHSARCRSHARASANPEYPCIPRLRRMAFMVKYCLRAVAENQPG